MQQQSLVATKCIQFVFTSFSYRLNAIFFFIFLDSSQFVGNSKSLQASIIMFLRKRKNLKYLSYTRGRNAFELHYQRPELNLTNLNKLKWVFGIIIEEFYENFDRNFDSLKVAVRSALENTSLVYFYYYCFIKFRILIAFTLDPHQRYPSGLFLKECELIIIILIF